MSVSNLSLPPWIAVALREVDQKEIAGSRDNPQIVKYHSAAHIAQAEFCDEIPWCASFVNWCLNQCGVDGTGKANARSFLEFGNSVDYFPGAIAVFKRSDDPTKGHVGFAMGICAGGDNVLVLGGNQDNRVSLKWFKLQELLSYRWPLSPVEGSF